MLKLPPDYQDLFYTVHPERYDRIYRGNTHRCYVCGESPQMHEIFCTKHMESWERDSLDDTPVIEWAVHHVDYNGPWRLPDIICPSCNIQLVTDDQDYLCLECRQKR